MYTGLDLNAVHMATTLEKFHINSSTNIACRVPCIMPLISSGKPTDSNSRIFKDNILNRKKDDIAISQSITTCNYVRLDIPNFLKPDIPYDKYGIVSPGINFLVVFVEGNINNIRIIGRA